MEPIGILSLWAPILLSAVLVFVASSLIHMFLPYHRNDYEALPDEDGVMDALRPFNIPPGEYVAPRAGSPDVMKSEAFQEKARRGPAFFVTFMAEDSLFKMGPQLVQWFLYCIVVSVFVAYLVGRTVPADAEYLQVFRVAGTVAFAAYGLGTWQRSVWYRQKTSTSIKNTVDALIYAMLTAGSFGANWPW